MQANLTCKCPALMVLKHGHMPGCPERPEFKADFTSDVQQPVTPPEIAPPAEPTAPAPQSPDELPPMSGALSMTPGSCVPAPVNFPPGIAPNIAVSKATRKRGVPFDNSTRRAAWSEVQQYFRTSSGKAALTKRIGRASHSRETISATELERIARTHRFGGLLFEIKQQVLICWTIERVGGDTYYTFYASAEPPAKGGVQ